MKVFGPFSPMVPIAHHLLNLPQRPPRMLSIQLPHPTQRFRVLDQDLLPKHIGHHDHWRLDIVVELVVVRVVVRGRGLGAGLADEGVLGEGVELGVVGGCVGGHLGGGDDAGRTEDGGGGVGGGVGGHPGGWDDAVGIRGGGGEGRGGTRGGGGIIILV